MTWTPLALFEGAWLDPSATTTLYRNAGRTLAARFNGHVKAVQDLSGNGNHAVQATMSLAPRYAQDLTTGKPCVWVKQGFDSLVIDFGSALGSDCTIVYANATSVEFLTGQTVGSTYTIAKTFFQFLILGRALSVAETDAVRTYFAAKCPSYSAEADYTYFADAAHGSDANNGLTRATAKQTLAAGYAQLFAGTSGARLCLLPGTYNNPVSSGGGTVAKTHSIHCPEAGVVIDLGQVPEVGLDSAFSVDAISYTLNLYGDGNLTIQNVGNNAFGCSGGGTGNIYDTVLTTADDGVSGHATATVRSYRVTAKNCTKSAFAHVGTCTAYHEFCAFYGKLAAGLGVGLFGEKGVNFTFDCCDFLPDPATTTTWTAFYVSSSAAGSGTGTTRLVKRSRFGSPSITPGSVGLSYLYATTIQDCYVGGLIFQSYTTPDTLQFTRCYGVFTVRPRFNSSSVVNIDNCVWSSGATSAQGTDIGVNADYYNGTTDVFGVGHVQNSIFTGCATGIFAVSNTAVFNAGWALTNNLFYSNTTNMTTGLTPDGTDVTGQNPLLIDTTSDEQEDWHVSAGSPSLGAGVGGTDIGLGIAA